MKKEEKEQEEDIFEVEVELKLKHLPDFFHRSVSGSANPRQTVSLEFGGLFVWHRVR